MSIDFWAACASNFGPAKLWAVGIFFAYGIGFHWRVDELVSPLQGGCADVGGQFWRLCVAPLVGILVALLLGVKDEQLGVLFLLLASPVAASSHVMVVAARGNGALAANIVVLTTLLSLVTITVGFFVLSMFSLVGQSQ